MLRQLPFQTRVSSFPPSLPGVGWAGIKTRQKSCFYRIHTVLDASVALVVFFLSQMPTLSTSMQFQFEPIIVIFGILLLIHFLLDTISIT